MNALHVSNIGDRERESIENIALKHGVTISDLVRDALNKTYPELNLAYSGKNPPKEWTKEEDDFILKYYSKYGVTELANQLEIRFDKQRLPGSIIARATRLGLHFPVKRKKHLQLS